MSFLMHLHLQISNRSHRAMFFSSSCLRMLIFFLRVVSTLNSNKGEVEGFFTVSGYRPVQAQPYHPEVTPLDDRWGVSMHLNHGIAIIQQGAGATHGTSEPLVAAPNPRSRHTDDQRRVWTALGSPDMWSLAQGPCPWTHGDEHLVAWGEYERKDPVATRTRNKRKPGQHFFAMRSY